MFRMILVGIRGPFSELNGAAVTLVLYQNAGFNLIEYFVKFGATLN